MGYLHIASKSPIIRLLEKAASPRIFRPCKLAKSKKDSPNGGKPMNQQLIALTIVGLIVVAFVLMLVVAIASGRKQAQEKRQTAEALGFTLLDPPPTDVAERLIPLHQKGYHQQLALRNLQQLRRPDCSLYLYDVWDVGGNDHDLESSDAVALVAADLDLPRFSIVPKVNVVGWTGDMANKFIEKLVGLHAQVIKFDEHPHFEQRYFVSGDNEFDVRRYISGPVLAALMQTQIEGLVISAWGDALMINSMNVGSTRKTDPLADVRARRDLALVLYERLRQA
jgi:hypothetical protein